MRKWIVTYRNLFALALLLGISLNVHSQQEWGYTQHLFNLYDINAAYAGNHNAASLAFRYRQQWIGFDGAPVTQQFSLHGPIARERIGAGLRIMRDELGARQNTKALFSLAYKAHFRNSTLSIGMAAGFIRQQYDIESLQPRDINDPVIIMMETTTTPVVNAALFFNSDKFYAGVEAGQLNRTYYTGDNSQLSRLYYHLFATAGYIHKISADDLLQFGTLIKFSEGMIYQAELNAMILCNNRYWLGTGYRLGNGAMLMACLNITPQWRFGVSYDISLNQSAIQENGSGEAFLGFNLKPKSSKSVRFF